MCGDGQLSYLIHAHPEDPQTPASYDLSDANLELIGGLGDNWQRGAVFKGSFKDKLIINNDN